MDTKNSTLERLGMSHVHKAGGVEEFKLNANGLKILLAENHAAPVVTVMVVYHVGSRNEAVGYTGSTHFLEHMMFKGTVKHNPAQGVGLDDMLKPIGALYNATTSYDRTNYYEVVAKEHLGLCLELEADRMRNLVLKVEDRNSEMTVVRNEFERGENEPSGVLYKELMATAFREHPYHHPVIGWRSDVEGVPMERMKEFYDTFYWPNNATVIVVGDFKPEEALTLIAEHFGKIPASPKPLPEVYTTEPAQEGERRFEVERAGDDLPMVWMGFKVPAATHADSYPLAALAAVLGGSRRSSRLYKALVDKGIAVNAFAQSGENRDPGLFIIGATCAPNGKPADLEAAILAEVEKLGTELVSDDELSRAKKANRKGTVLSMADPISFANQLCQAEAVADWKWMMEYDDKFDAVTPAEIARVAKQYFARRNRTVGTFSPTGSSDANEAAQAEMASHSQSPGEAPAAAEAPAKVDTFASKVTRRVLANGLTVIVAPNAGTGSVALAAKVKAGSYFGTKEKSLVPELTAYMLTRGTKKLDKTQLGEMLEEMGVNLRFGCDNFAVSTGSTVVAEDFGVYLSLVADALRNPVFPADELAKAKREFVGFIRRNSSDTGSQAENKLSQVLYGADSVYFDKPFAELLKELEAITVDDLVAFHKDHYGPKGTIVTIAGDIDVDAAFKHIDMTFTSWTGAEPKAIDLDSVAPSAAQLVTVPMADKANVDIVIGLAAEVKRSSPDFLAARIANAALGQDTLASRLGIVVREKHGLTYGINSAFKDPSFGGAPWTITLSVNPENVDKALELTRGVVEEYVTNGISDKELADEVGRAYGGFVVNLRTSLGLANVLTQFEFLGLGVADLDRYQSDLASLTKDQVNAAIRKYFRLDQAVTVLAGTLAASK